MKTFYIIRHGQTDQNKKVLIQGRINTELNDTGILQAKEASELLKDIRIDSIYSSPLNRAYSTAFIIRDALHLNIPVIKHPLLIERDFGDSEGKKVDSIDFENVLLGKVKNQELNKDLETRALEAIKDITQKDNNENILIVSHAHFIKGLLISLNYPNYDYHSPLLNSSLTIIKEENGKYTVECINKK